MTVSRLPKRAEPTNSDLQQQIAEAHECLHNVGESVKALADTVRTDRRELTQLDLRTARLEASVDLLVQFFRLDKGRVTPGIGSMAWWQAFLGMAGSVLGALTAWKFIFPALVAMHHAILASH